MVEINAPQRGRRYDQVWVVRCQHDNGLVTFQVLTGTQRGTVDTDKTITAIRWARVEELE